MNSVVDGSVAFLVLRNGIGSRIHEDLCYLNVTLNCCHVQCCLSAVCYFNLFLQYISQLNIRFRQVQSVKIRSNSKVDNLKIMP